MEKVKIGDVCNILNGFAFKSENYVGSGIRVIRIANVQKGYIEDTTPAFYPLDSGGLDKYMLENGDLLMSLTGNVGRVAMLEADMLPAALNQRVACLRLKSSKISKKYLFHILNSDYFEQQCIQSSKGVAQKNMSTEWLKDYEIPLYSPEQQNKIVSVLDRVHLIINTQKKQLQKLDELVKARFAEMFGDPEVNPYGWNQITVKDVCSSIVRGPFGSALKKDFFVEPSSTTYKVYEQKHAIQKDASIGTYYVTAEKYQELKRFECVPGDIIMSCSGTMGELYQLPVGCEKGIINQALCKFTLNEKMRPTCFLTYMKQTIGNLETKGSGIKNIAAVSYVKAMPINLPPMSVQVKFEEFVHQVDKSKAVEGLYSSLCL